jgi:two-component system chemotaxis sensor kinase CheA
MFLAECREHLQELNLAVVRIEEQPDDRATVDEIFRIAHSLKGMSATMGFEGMAALTHQMEDVFELLRQRTGGLARETVDVLLECLDALSGATDAIESDGAERLEPAPLIERLKGLVRDRTPVQAVARHGVEAAAALPDAVADALVAGRAMLHGRITLADDTLMPAVRVHGHRRGRRPRHRRGLRSRGRPRRGLRRPSRGPVGHGRGRGCDAQRGAGLRARRRHRGGHRGRRRGRDPRGRPCGHPVVVSERADASRAAATVRVDAERLDQLMHLMGELVVQRTQVEVLAAQAEVPGLSQAMQDLTRCSHALQAIVMQVRMIPVEAVFLRFPRLVRDLSGKLGKQVELSSSARTPSSTVPSSTRSVTRSCTSCATHSTTAWRRRPTARPPARRPLARCGSPRATRAAT